MKVRILILILLISVGQIFSQINIKSIGESTKSNEDYTKWLFGETVLAISNGIINTEKMIKLSSQSTNADLINYSERYLVTTELGKGQLINNVFDDKGEQVTSIIKPWDVDMPVPAIQISGKHKRLFSVEIGGKVSCYSFTGELIWEKYYMDDYQFNYENTYFCNPSNSAEEMIFTWSYPSLDEERMFTTAIVKVNKDGEISNEIRYSDTIVLNVAADRKSGLLVISRIGTPNPGFNSEPVISILDSDFNEIWQTKGVFRKAGFFENQYIFIIKKQQIQIIDISSGSSIYSSKLKNEINIYDSAIIFNNRLVAVSGTPAYDKGELYFNNSNIEFHRLKEQQVTIRSLDPVNYLPDGLSIDREGNILIGAKQGLYRIEE
jgi:hypothetical protein